MEQVEGEGWARREAKETTCLLFHAGLKCAHHHKKSDCVSERKQQEERVYVFSMSLGDNLSPWATEQLVDSTVHSLRDSMLPTLSGCAGGGVGCWGSAGREEGEEEGNAARH